MDSELRPPGFRLSTALLDSDNWYSFYATTLYCVALTAPLSFWPGGIIQPDTMSALCHVWTAPSWQELSSRLQHWSVQPCVRPLSAAHRAAGHNALRGSGPDQKHAFDHALAQVGCPDRRIDRLCITCCSPSQPSHHAGCPARSRLRRKRDGFLVALAPGHQHPHHPRNLVGERDGGNLARPSC